MLEKRSHVLWNKVTRPLLVACFLFVTAIGVVAGQTISWSMDCASGDYAVIPRAGQSVTIECYELDAPPPSAGDNQLVNGEFAGEHNSTVIPGWANDGDGAGNEYVISLSCLDCKNKTTTGYAVKWGPKSAHGDGVPGVEGYLRQVVPAHGRTLTAKITGTTFRATTMNINIYGRVAGGAWSLVWRPFTRADFPDGQWPKLEDVTVLNQDYSEFMFEIESRWDGDNSPGAKYGDAFFRSDS